MTNFWIAILIIVIIILILAIIRSLLQLRLKQLKGRQNEPTSKISRRQSGH